MQEGAGSKTLCLVFFLHSFSVRNLVPLYVPCNLCTKPSTYHHSKCFTSTMKNGQYLQTFPDAVYPILCFLLFICGLEHN